MFSGMNALGAYTDSFQATPGGFPNWMDRDYVPDTDIDMIAAGQYAPDSGYTAHGYGRVRSYDLPLAERQTLDGVGMSRPAGQQKSGLSGPRRWLTGSMRRRAQAPEAIRAQAMEHASPKRITQRIRMMMR